MTNDKDKVEEITELRKKYFVYLSGLDNPIQLSEREKVIINKSFDFFYSEIERLHNTDDYLRGHVDGYADATVHSEAKLKAADEVIEKSKNLCTYTTYPRHKESYKQALEHYNNLKTKV